MLTINVDLVDLCRPCRPVFIITVLTVCRLCCIRVYREMNFISIFLIKYSPIRARIQQGLQMIFALFWCNYARLAQPPQTAYNANNLLTHARI